MDKKTKTEYSKWRINLFFCSSFLFHYNLSWWFTCIWTNRNWFHVSKSMHSNDTTDKETTDETTTNWYWFMLSHLLTNWCWICFPFCYFICPHWNFYVPFCIEPIFGWMYLNRSFFLMINWLKWEKQNQKNYKKKSKWIFHCTIYLTRKTNASK